MSEVIWVAIIGVVGTIAGSLIGFLSNKHIESKRVKNDTRQYVSRLQFDLQLNILKQLSKAFFKVLVISNTVEKDIKSEDQKLIDDKSTYKRLVEVTSDAQDLLFENAPFIPEDLFDKYDKLNSTISKLFWDYYNYCVDNSKTIQESCLKDITTYINLIEHMIREINADIRKLLSNTSIITNEIL